MGNSVLASEGEIEVTRGHDVGLDAALKQLGPVNQGEVQLSHLTVIALICIRMLF